MTNTATTHAPALRAALWAALSLASVWAGACAVGPDYEAPPARVPADFVGAQAPAPAEAAPSGISRAVPGPTDTLRWWTKFNDDTLTSLIERALATNLDVLQAEARIRQARAARGVAGSFLLPTVDVNASATRSRTPITSSVGATNSFYRAGFDAAWEIDVFGGIRRGVEVADADIQAAIEDQRFVLVSLAAEVATTYSDLRGFQQQIDIANRNVEAQRKSARLSDIRYQGGFVSGLDVAQADAQVASSLARIPSFEIAARQAIYALGVLLGREPTALIDELSAPGPLPPAPPEVPIGLPSDMLRRRPDIRTAEANLHAATARIGVATADLFPKFSLTGSLGLQGNTITALSTSGQNFWSFGPSVTWPLFAGGRIHANIAVQEALKDQAFLTYQQVVLTALQEVESTLIACDKEQQRLAALTDAVRADTRAVDLATQLYSAGRTDFLNVLTAQQALFNAQDALSQSQTLVVTDFVALYKALGGGWESAAPEPEEAAPSPAPSPSADEPPPPPVATAEPDAPVPAQDAHEGEIGEHAAE